VVRADPRIDVSDTGAHLNLMAGTFGWALELAG
jgi:hypothetical protein